MQQNHTGTGNKLMLYMLYKLYLGACLASY